MTLLEFALDYNQCRIAELRRFIKERTGRAFVHELDPHSVAPNKEPYNGPTEDGEDFALAMNLTKNNRAIAEKTLDVQKLKYWNTDHPELEQTARTQGVTRWKLDVMLDGFLQKMRARREDLGASFKLFRLWEEKGTYIMKLWELDRSATFRFFDLPGEVRNAVYEEVLTPRDEGVPKGVNEEFLKILREDEDGEDEAFGRHKIWSPQLLQTCRTAYKEGYDYVYHDDTTSLKIHIPRPDAETLPKPPSKARTD
jgi:hypothetical protein